jgi:hypothetical protein
VQNGEGGKAASAELAELVCRLGRNGLGRVEIAAELGVGLEALAWMERRSARLAEGRFSMGARSTRAGSAGWERRETVGDAVVCGSFAVRFTVRA